MRVKASSRLHDSLLFLSGLAVRHLFGPVGTGGRVLLGSLWAPPWSLVLPISSTLEMYDVCLFVYAVAAFSCS